MKNQVIIILDTDAPQPIQIGKTNPVQPTTKEELSEIMLLDMGTLCEALTVLIRECHKQGVKNETESLKSCIHHLEQGFIDSEMTTRTFS